MARTASPTSQQAGRQLARIGGRFHARGWMLGTSGNLSAVVSGRPPRVLITRSAAHKGRLTAREFLRIDEAGAVIGRPAHTPSAETRLHLEIVGSRGAGAVLHTHSVWGTILSDLHAAEQGLSFDGYEMLKGLSGVTTHAHGEWLPILDNDQDMVRLAGAVRGLLASHPRAHGFLLRGHGLYTWGATIDEAERHVEVLEFLLEVTGRAGRRSSNHGGRDHP